MFHETERDDHREAATQVAAGSGVGRALSTRPAPDGELPSGREPFFANSLRQTAHGKAGRRRQAPAGLVFAGAVGLAALIAVGSLGAKSARSVTPPGWPRSFQSIHDAIDTGPHVGLCDECHSEHSPGGNPQANALIGPDDNTLCDGCHTSTPWKGGSYGGTWLYVGSAHGSNSSMVWPGPNPPARSEAGAQNKCLNCHDPHGYQDAAGNIPHLEVAREENLCLTCHSGQPAQVNVKLDLQKGYHHPVVEYSGRHTGALESSPSSFGSSPVDNRHAECEDCHNSHLGRSDPSGSFDPSSAPKSILGVSRVLVQNGSAGSSPTYTFVPGSDTLSGPPTEYQLCFKCHSSWTVQPSGQTDLARALNPNNPSYHPVESTGKDPAINPLSFASGTSAMSMTQCNDCHGSDMGSSRGPHGSDYRFILKQSYTASSLPRTMTSDELCFTCHSYQVYADPTSAENVLAYSRFNRPAVSKGHADHVGGAQVPCYACHATHGSADQKHLLVTGRSPGIVSFTETATGGTCTPTCHAPATYQLNYAH